MKTMCNILNNLWDKYNDFQTQVNENIVSSHKLSLWIALWAHILSTRLAQALTKWRVQEFTAHPSILILYLMLQQLKLELYFQQSQWNWTYSAVLACAALATVAWAGPSAVAGWSTVASHSVVEILIAGYNLYLNVWRWRAVVCIMNVVAFICVL